MHIYRNKKNASDISLLHKQNKELVLLIHAKNNSSYYCTLKLINQLQYLQAGKYNKHEHNVSIM